MHDAACYCYRTLYLTMDRREASRRRRSRSSSSSRRRRRSSDTSGSEEQSADAGSGRSSSRKKERRERRKAKERMKKEETPAERRARRLQKRRDKEARRKEREISAGGFSNEANPFGDSELSNVFVWTKKHEKEAKKVDRFVLSHSKCDGDDSIEESYNASSEALIPSYVSVTVTCTL